MAAFPPNERQSSINAANASFWDEICGSTAARAWGITDSSMASLRRYDENFLNFYPYLESHVEWGRMRGKRVLEIGLGYGTVSQKLAESGAIYTGLDIAANPVAMVRHRLTESGIAGQAIQGNVLNPPCANDSFDAIVAIGCLHHTGNLRAAIASCRRLLAPGGRLIGMVYYAYSFRQLWNEPKRALRYRARELFGYRGTVRDGETSAYDRSLDGSLAPATEFISVRSLRAHCNDFVEFRARTENANQEPPFSRWTREQLLSSPLPRLCGLDLYWTCVKSRRG